MLLFKLGPLRFIAVLTTGPPPRFSLLSFIVLPFFLLVNGQHTLNNALEPFHFDLKSTRWT